MPWREDTRAWYFIKGILTLWFVKKYTALRAALDFGPQSALGFVLLIRLLQYKKAQDVPG